ncbi:MAG: hypothetical protein PVJ15_05765 [Gammaproteobacteria bacterium]
MKLTCYGLQFGKVRIAGLNGAGSNGYVVADSILFPCAIIRLQENSWPMLFRQAGPPGLFCTSSFIGFIVGWLQRPVIVILGPLVVFIVSKI